MANDKVKDAQEPTIDVLVAKRKTVDFDGRLYGPGAKLTLPIREAKSLYDKGFVVEPGEPAGSDTDPETAGGDGVGLSVQTSDKGQ